MLTKDDLQAIKELLHANNKILLTLWRIESAEINRRLDKVANDTQELKRTTARLEKGQQRVEDKVYKIDSEERKKLKQRIETLEVSVKNLISS